MLLQSLLISLLSFFALSISSSYATTKKGVYLWPTDAVVTCTTAAGTSTITHIIGDTCVAGCSSPQSLAPCGRRRQGLCVCTLQQGTPGAVRIVVELSFKREAVYE